MGRQKGLICSEWGVIPEDPMREVMIKMSDPGAGIFTLILGRRHDEGNHKAGQEG